MPELDAKALIAKHRHRGVLVDTNLLVLYLVGAVNKRRILQFKRTQGFTVDDYELLTRLVRCFGKLIATPHLLSQVSDLADLTGKELRMIRRLFKVMVEQLEESYEPSRLLVGDKMFERFGLTDTAIAQVCCNGVLVLTADLDLQLELQRRGADALNFNHVRQLSWN